jgi:uncharacterized protein YggE
LTTCPAWGREGGQAFPLAEVEAEGEVLARPDTAVLIFAVETEALQAQEAAADNAKKSEAFLAQVKRMLAPEEKVQSAGYRVFPIYRLKEKIQAREKVRTDEIMGYRAQHTFRVELRDMLKIGKVSDAGVKQGASRVQGPYWDHSKKEELQQQAAVIALKRARSLAEGLAQAAGLKVKGLVKVSTAHAYRPMPLGLARAAAPAEREPETPIEVGEEKFQARVTATFELAP